MASDKTPRRLGRGLDALFNTATAEIEKLDSSLKEIPLSQIRSNPFQPRKNFNDEELKELRESLNTSGLLQPITVRRSPGSSNDYELIAGERRLRAAADLGWSTISAIVKDPADRDLLALALVENLQRSDLNPIEEAEGYSRLISEFGHSQQSIASMVGRDRSTIANMLRILQLPTPVQKLVRDGLLSVGHVRPLLALGDEASIVSLAREIQKKGLSARDVEQRVRQAQSQISGPRKRGRPPHVDSRPAEVRAMEARLRRLLQTDVLITANSQQQGAIKISFYSSDDFERIVDLIGLTS